MKQILRVLCVATAFIAQSTIATVNPQPGENIWRLTAAIGTTLDQIESKLDLASECASIVITQEDVDAGGGTFTITGSGSYCLGGNIVGTILIDFSYVTLSINNFALQNADNAIILGANVTDVVITGGGTITTTLSTPPVGSTAIADFGRTVRTNITIQNVTIEGWDTGIQLSNIDGLKLNNLIIGNADFRNNIGVQLSGGHTIDIRNCNFIYNNNDGLFLFSGCDGITIEDCSAVNNSGNGFDFDNASNLYMKNCNACGQASGFAGFNCTDSTTVVLEDCSAQDNDIGFNLSSGMGIIRQCTAHNNTTGFVGDGTTDFQFYQNYACDNIVSYSAVVTAPITSPANALGADNIDCSSNDPDQIDLIESYVQLIDSKLDTISGGGSCNAQSIIEQLGITIVDQSSTVIDQLGITIVDAFQPVNSTLDVINSKLDTISSGDRSIIEQLGITIVDQAQSIIEQLGVTIVDEAQTVIEQLGATVVEELKPVESILDVINSKLDFLNTCSAQSITQEDVNAAHGTYSITRPGSYCLSGDITGQINIASSYVTLNLNNYTLQNSSGPAITSTPPISDIVITGGRVVSPIIQSVGILLGSDINVTIDNVTVEGWTTGISLSLTNGIQLSNLVTNSNQSGMFISQCNQVTVQDCLARNNTTNGLNIQSSNQVLCQNVNMLGNAAGIEVNSSLITLKNCVAADGTGIGFGFSGTTTCIVEDCVAQGNATGFNMGAQSGIVQRCTAQDNDTGFLSNGTSDIQFFENVACGNSLNNYLGVTSAPITSPANALGADNIDCSNVDPDQIDVIESFVQDIDSKLDSCSSTAIYQSSIDDGGGVYTIFNSGKYCLAEDVHGSIDIATNSVCLDLDCHQIFASSNSPITLQTAVQHVSISNGSITELDGHYTFTGIDASVGDVFDLQISNVYLQGLATGIAVGSSSNSITLNDITTSNIASGPGIYLRGCVGVTVRGCECAFGLVGIVVQGGASIDIRDCMCYENTGVGGMYILSAEGVYIADSTAFFNTTVGFNIAGYGVEVVNCIATSNQQYGFFMNGINGGFDTLIRDCYASENTFAGFYSDNTSALNMYGNTAQSNGSGSTNQGGFFISGAVTPGGIIQSCVANGNVGHGFITDSGSANKFYNNIACYNSTGQYSGVVDAPVTSAVNAHGAYNIDCSNTTVDQFSTIESKLDILLTRTF